MRYHLKLLLLIIFFRSIVVCAQINYSLTNKISSQNLNSHVKFLANTSLKGRQTGSAGDSISAHYINSFFKSNYLLSFNPTKDNYYQTVPLTRDSLNVVRFNINGSALNFEKDYFIDVENAISVNLNSEKVVFVGYGITTDNYDDYLNVSVKGKVVMLLSGEPKDSSGTSLVTGTKVLSDWSTIVNKKLRNAKDRGALAVLKIIGNFEKTLAYSIRANSNPKIRSIFPKTDTLVLNNIFISESVADKLFESQKHSLTRWKIDFNKTHKASPFIFSVPINITIKCTHENISAYNVLAFIEGTDLKQECIVITAHHDHIGVKNHLIYTGADDNSSGCAALLEIAKTFAELKKEGKSCKRSIVFLSTTGEEHGLLGAYYYVNYPFFKLSTTKAVLNIDMIGRNDSTHALNGNYVYAICSDTTNKLKQILEDINKASINLTLDYKYNSKEETHHFYYRSDQYAFIEKNIPTIFFLDGMNEDYHKPSDTYEKINFSILEKRTRLAFLTAWQLANDY